MRFFVIALIPFVIIRAAAAATMDEIFSNVVKSCECSTIEVQCSDEAVKKCSPVAGACAIGCTMLLTQGACTDLGIRPGRTTPADLINGMQCSLKDLDGKTPDDILKRVNSCGWIIHEMVHNCNNLPPYQAVCEEVAGARLKIAFTEKALSVFCKTPEQQGPITNLSPICKKLCEQAFNEEYIAAWTRCLCDASKNNDSFLGLGEWLTPSECCNCNSRCKKKQLSSGSDPLPPFCKEYVSQPDVAKKFDGEWNAACDTLSFDPNHYSCGKMSRNGAAQFGSQCN